MRNTLEHHTKVDFSVRSITTTKYYFCSSFDSIEFLRVRNNTVQLIDTKSAILIPVLPKLRRDQVTVMHIFIFWGLGIFPDPMNSRSTIYQTLRCFKTIYQVLIVELWSCKFLRFRCCIVVLQHNRVFRSAENYVKLPFRGFIAIQTCWSPIGARYDILTSISGLVFLLRQSGLHFRVVYLRLFTRHVSTIFILTPHVHTVPCFSPAISGYMLDRYLSRANTDSSWHS